jgi:hypothetical protein
MSEKFIGQLYASYDSCNLIDGTVPIWSQSNYTISQLSSEFIGKLNIELGESYEIIINGKTLKNYSAVPPNFNKHQEYINLIGYEIGQLYDIKQ